MSAYRNAKIKTLLADVLALRLGAVRQERAGLQGEAEQVARELSQLGDTTARIVVAQSAKAGSQAALDAAKAELASASRRATSRSKRKLVAANSQATGPPRCRWRQPRGLANCGEPPLRWRRCPRLNHARTALFEQIFKPRKSA